jgi:probable HAF family extracellular repeat protein
MPQPYCADMRNRWCVSRRWVTAYEQDVNAIASSGTGTVRPLLAAVVRNFSRRAGAPPIPRQGSTTRSCGKEERSSTLARCRVAHPAPQGGINDRGLIAGTSSTLSLAPWAVVWADGIMTLLGTLPGATFSSAIAINKRGQVVGRSDQRPVLWDGDAILELGMPAGGTSATAVAINDRGEIVGQYDTGRGETHAVLWTTRPPKQ